MAERVRPCDECGVDLYPNGTRLRRCKECKRAKDRRDSAARRTRERDQGEQRSRATQLTRRCDDCGIDVSRTHPTGAIQERCNACRQAHRVQLTANSRARNRDAVPHYRREQVAAPARSSSAPQSRACDGCGAEVPRTKPKGPIAKRCPDCTIAKRNQEIAEWRQRNPDAGKRYGRERTERRRQQRGTRSCPVCQNEFEPRRVDTIYCGVLCETANRDSDDRDEAREILARRRAAREAAVADPLCDHCREMLKRNAQGVRPSRFCSLRCMRAWHSKARRHMPSRRNGQLNYRHKERTRELGVESPGVTWTEWRRILDFYGHRCAYCGSGQDIERDHIVPITRGGLHEPGNVVPACRPCNREKRDQLLHEWRPDLVIDCGRRP